MKRVLKWVFSFVLLLLSVLYLGNLDIEAKEAASSGLDLSRLYGEFDLKSDATTGVIVELEASSLIEAKHMGEDLDAEDLQRIRKQVLEEVLRKVPEAKVTREFDYLFSGFAVELPGSNVLDLLSVSGISAVYPDVRYEVPELKVRFLDENPLMTQSNPYVGAPEVWRMGYTGEGMVVAVIDSGVDYTSGTRSRFEYKGYGFRGRRR